MMSETAKRLFESLRGAKQAVMQIAPGLKDLIPEVGAEIKRLGIQGSMEFSSGLWNGNAFVPYGPGQYTENPGKQPAEHGHEYGQER
jgi:hypothetical protein